MTERQLNYLLLAILCFVGITTLLLAHAAWGQEKSDWRFMYSGYAYASFAGSMGYEDPGIGAQLEGSARWKMLELYAYGNLDNQVKKDASSGYTWSYGFQGRGYVWKGLYLHADYSDGGYKSNFDNGTSWVKNSDHYGGGAGYYWDNMLDVWATIYNRETGSPNDVWASNIKVRWKIYKYLWGMGKLQYATWDQIYSGVTHRLSGLTSTIGIGVRF